MILLSVLYHIEESNKIEKIKMSKRKIVRLGTEIENHLHYKDDKLYYPILDENPVLTLETLANFCDQEAESRNNHRFVGSHRILSALLFKQLGREKATIIMQEIAGYSGLDGMMGLEQDVESAFDDFGLKDDWSEWELGK